MSQVFSIPVGSLGEAVGPAIVLFVTFLGLITGTDIRTTQTMIYRPIHLGR